MVVEKRNRSGVQKGRGEKGRSDSSSSIDPPSFGMEITKTTTTNTIEFHLKVVKVFRYFLRGERGKFDEFYSLLAWRLRRE